MDQAVDPQACFFSALLAVHGGEYERASVRSQPPPPLAMMSFGAPMVGTPARFMCRSRGGWGSSEPSFLFYELSACGGR